MMVVVAAIRDMKKVREQVMWLSEEREFGAKERAVQ